MAEKNKEFKPEVKPEVKPSISEFKIAEKFGEMTLRSLNKRFKKHEDLKVLADEVKKIQGLEAKYTNTYFQAGVKLTTVKGYPAPRYFTDLFSEKQRKEIFK